MEATLPVRKNWIDALRAMAILLVVFGHQVQWWDDYFSYTSAVKVPLFFAISGYLFNTRNGDIKFFFSNLLKKIVIPYFLLAVAYGIITIPILGVNHLPTYLYKIFSGDSFWFMPCLIIGEIFFFFSLKYIKERWIVGILTVVYFLVGLWLVKNDILSFGMVNNAMVIQLFLFMGYVFKQQEQRPQNIDIRLVILGGIVYFFLCFIGSKYHLSDTLDVHLGDFGCLPFTLFLILWGNVFVFSLAMKIKHYPRFLVFIGQNTLLQYMWAGLGIAPILLFMKIRNIPTPEESLFFSCMCFVSSVIICSICSLFVNKYLPFMVGKTKK